jgi:hypothetical protein
MPINPQFLAARAAERRQRLLTHLALPELVAIPLRRGGAFRVPQVLITERIRLELHLAGNALVCGRAPLLGDVFLCLWRHHPEFRRPLPARAAVLRDLGRWPALLRLALLRYAYGDLSVARLHRWLSRRVAACDLFAAEKILAGRLRTAEQDAPAAAYESGAGTPSAAAPEFCAVDDLVDWLSTTYGLSPAAALDVPRALVHQLWRNRQLAQPDGELAVFAPSDALLSAAPAASPA